MNEKYSPRREVLEYMKWLGEYLEVDLDDEERDLLESEEKLLFSQRIFEAERGSVIGREFYLEMERFYDTYVCPKVTPNITRFLEDFYNLIGRVQTRLQCGIKSGKGRENG